MRSTTSPAGSSTSRSDCAQHSQPDVNTEALPLARLDQRGPQGAWAIYSDGARGFYARRWYIGKFILLSTDEVLEGEKLEDVRAKLPPNLINCGRDDDEAPGLVEWWV